MEAEGTVRRMTSDSDKRVEERLIVALDSPTYEDARRIVRLLSPSVRWFKVGSVLFTREGPQVCHLVKDAGAQLFLDLKFHDIPNTVAGAVRSACTLGADMLTVHVSGGKAMLAAAVQARNEVRGETLIVGVTVLTHLKLEDFQALFVSDQSPQEMVLALSKLAGSASLNGVVASAKELSLIKRHLGPKFLVVTPGIRMPEDAQNDQTRVVTPKEAVSDGADYLVVGRPIIGAPDPAAACRRILDDMTA
jgi:orotidine-5'-phosphate decarboxylase